MALETFLSVSSFSPVKRSILTSSFCASPLQSSHRACISFSRRRLPTALSSEMDRESSAVDFFRSSTIACSDCSSAAAPFSHISRLLTTTLTEKSTTVKTLHASPKPLMGSIAPMVCLGEKPKYSKVFCFVEISRIFQPSSWANAQLSQGLFDA
ncbi:uncharacterized protein BKA78DRAFT_53716 [Phyllosticta capitalensis]|uniref:uncharacterized protein n=1 Tax=Phyllosticta capitalensis TaxID=121624 RepID=UPI00312EA15B